MWAGIWNVGRRLILSKIWYFQDSLWKQAFSTWPELPVETHVELDLGNSGISPFLFNDINLILCFFLSYVKEVRVLEIVKIG